VPLGVALGVPPPASDAERCAVALTPPEALTVAAADAEPEGLQRGEGEGLMLGVAEREAVAVFVAEPGTTWPALPGMATAKDAGPAEPAPNCVALPSTGAPTAHAAPVFTTPYSTEWLPHAPVPSRYAHPTPAAPSA